jgi:hypothetical protein
VCSLKSSAIVCNAWACSADVSFTHKVIFRLTLRLDTSDVATSSGALAVGVRASDKNGFGVFVGEVAAIAVCVISRGGSIASDWQAANKKIPIQSQ